MSALAVDMSFDYNFPSASIEQPSPPPPPAAMASTLWFDPSFYAMPSYYIGSHSRSSSRASSFYSAATAATAATTDSAPDSLCSRLSTPPRASPHPPARPCSAAQDPSSGSASRHHPRHARTATPPAPQPSRSSGHARSFTSPDCLSGFPFDSSPSGLQLPSTYSTPFSNQRAESSPAPLLNSPLPLSATTPRPCLSTPSSRRASSCGVVDDFTYSAYHHMSSYMPADSFSSVHYGVRDPSPLSQASTPDPVQTTTLRAYLTGPNPAASLVRTVSFPLRDPNLKHFWWDVRSVRAWSGFNAASILRLPGADALLSTPVPAPALPQPAFSSRHPETEAALHAIYASFYLPKLNAALAISSARPLQLSVPSRKASAAPTAGPSDLLFVANVPGEAATAAALFGGKPSARVVGIVRSFDRFNTGMRAEGNIKRVEYLRGLAAVHHAMREHGCRYGFILTEIELVVVRNGTDPIPFFGDLEIASIQLAAAVANDDDDDAADSNTPMTACLALWGLCQLAADDTPAGHAAWRADIGAPAEGTRRKAQPRDSWIPQPQLAEKREAKRSRGWVWPEDAIGRKELGKRGVRYGGI